MRLASFLLLALAIPAASAMDASFDSPAQVWSVESVQAVATGTSQMLGATSLTINFTPTSSLELTRLLTPTEETTFVQDAVIPYRTYRWTFEDSAAMVVSEDIQQALVGHANGKLQLTSEATPREWSVMNGVHPRETMHGQSMFREYHGALDAPAGSLSILAPESEDLLLYIEGRVEWQGGTPACFNTEICSDMDETPPPGHRFIDLFQAESVTARWRGGDALMHSTSTHLQGNFAGRMQGLQGEMCTRIDCQDGDALRISGTMNWSLHEDEGRRIQGDIQGEIAAARLENKAVDPSAFNAAMVTATAGTLALIGALASKFGFFALFTRIAPDKALEHPRRQRLYDFIQEAPGATFREIVRETGVPAGTTRHHLTVLRRSELIVEKRHKSTLRFFENHGKYDATWDTVVMLREEPLQVLHAWLSEHPVTKQKDVVEAMDAMHAWSRGTTQHRLSRLVNAGLVTIREQGRLKLYTAHATPQPIAAPMDWRAMPYA